MVSKKNRLYLPASNVKSVNFQRIDRLDQMRQLNPIEFENFVGYLFHASRNCRVETTKTSGDEGIDLYLFKNGLVEVVQCKRYEKSIAASHVRDFYGSMMHVKATQGYIVTTGTISAPSRLWAKDKPIQLIDGVDLENWARRINYNAETYNRLPTNQVARPKSSLIPANLVKTTPQSYHPQLKNKNSLRILNPKNSIYAMLAIIAVISIIAILIGLTKPANGVSVTGSLPPNKILQTVATTPTISAENENKKVIPVESTVNIVVSRTTIILPTITPLASATIVQRTKDAASMPCYVGQIKGNAASHFYHLPGWFYYTSFSANNTNVRCFDTETEARAAGYKPGRIR